MSAVRKSENKVTIKIPRILYNQLSDIVAGTGFNSVTDFIIYVMRDLVSTPTQADSSQKGELTKEEIEAIRKRLKTLGYL